MWNFARKKIFRERGELPKEEGDAVREYKALHEENFLSSWLREDVRGREEKTAKVSEKNEGERVKRGKEKRRKNRTKTERVKRRWEVCLLWKPLKSFVKVEIWRVVVVFLGRTSWRSMRTCLTVSLIHSCACACGACCDCFACFPFFCGH